MSLLIIILFSIFFQSTEVVSQTVLCHVEKCNRYVAFPLNILIFSEYIRGSKLLVENALLNFLSFLSLFNVNDWYICLLYCSSLSIIHNFCHFTCEANDYFCIVDRGFHSTLLRALIYCRFGRNAKCSNGLSHYLFFKFSKYFALKLFPFELTQICRGIILLHSFKVVRTPPNSTNKLDDCKVGIS